MDINTPFSIWAVNQHVITNHFYDGDLPYSHHLKMVVREAENFKSLIYNIEFPLLKSILPSTKEEIIVNSCRGHDLIEDTMVSYNDIMTNGGDSYTADIIYALTNEKSKSRSERANPSYYKGIKETAGAQFVKMCDRIANVKYGVMTGSEKVEMYKK